MENKFSFSTALPEEKRVFDLYLTTGWNDAYKITPPEFMEALLNSWYCLSAYDDNRLVGFGRMICDGILHALILDLIVHPDFQGKGLGGEILSRLVEKCRESRIRDIQLFSVKGKAGFYRKLGFRERPEGAPGMEVKLHQDW
jgi:GNAT superfamily N-acetyltransferase